MKVKVLLLLMLPALWMPAAQAARAEQRYKDTFSIIVDRLGKNSTPLGRDVYFACNPKTPPEMALEARPDEETEGESQKEKAQKAAKVRRRFLNSLEGKSWLQKRAQMRRVLSKTLPARLAPIRRDLKRLRSISPVPASMTKANALVREYSRLMDKEFDSMKAAVAKGTIEGTGLIENLRLVSHHYRAATKAMGF